MKTMCLKATVLTLAIPLVLCAPSADGSSETATSDLATTVSIELPKVEKDFSVIDHPRDLDTADRKTFAATIPPKTIKRIILLRDHDFDVEQKVRADADRMFSQLVKSKVRSTPWGLDALERTVAECLVLTKRGEVFKVTALGQLPNPKGSVTGVLLYGKGFSRRFDFRESPLQCGTRD